MEANIIPYTHSHMFTHIHTRSHTFTHMHFHRRMHTKRPYASCTTHSAPPHLAGCSPSIQPHLHLSWAHSTPLGRASRTTTPFSPVSCSSGCLWMCCGCTRGCCEPQWRWKGCEGDVRGGCETDGRNGRHGGCGFSKMVIFNKSISSPNLRMSIFPRNLRTQSPDFLEINTHNTHTVMLSLSFLSLSLPLLPLFFPLLFKF